METITIIVLIIIGIALGFILTKGLSKDKKQNSEIKIDNPPITKDKVVTLYDTDNFILTKDILLYQDIDGDKITHVRFNGDVDRFFVDSNFTENYKAGSELPIDFKIYIKFKSVEDSVTVNYDVKSNNIWSK